MRLLTWNINGVLTMPNYYPWTQYRGDYDAILDSLDADIICFQETKITRNKVPKKLASPSRWDTYLSCYRRQPPKGYAGTAIFTKRAQCVASKAEEGLSGILQEEDPKIPRAAYVDGHPSTEDCEALGLDVTELRDLDSEGRVTVADLGLFVLISIYSPNLTNEARGSFKDYFNLLTEARVRALIKAGRQVIVAGDLNICSQEIDHADPYKNLPKDGSMKFTDTRPRTWFNHLIGEEGILIDVCRKFNPTMKGMYTCWETRIDARSSNYGTRIDYVLITPGLLPWIKHSATAPQIKGSDHCPVYIDLHDSITAEDGTQRHLWNELNPPSRTPAGPDPDPPTFAGRFWPEFAHKLLSSFFGNKSVATSSPAPSPTPQPSATSAPPAETSTSSESLATRESSEQDQETSRQASTSFETVEAQVAAEDNDTDVEVVPRPSSSQPEKSSQTKSVKGKEKQSSSNKSAAAKASSSQKSYASKPKDKTGKGKQDDKPQTTLASFFGAPVQAKDKDKEKKPSHKRKHSEDSNTGRSKAKRECTPDHLEGVDLEEQRRVEASILEGSGNSPDTSRAWSDMFKRQPAPLCQGHSEACKELVTTKPGPNKGRKFWLCARPKGPADDTSGDYQCDHFEFSTRVSRPYLVGGDAALKAKKCS